MMKKIFTIFLALTMAVGLLAGCGKKNAAETGERNSNNLSVVTTIFPEYDWIKEILGDKAGSTDLTMLLNSGVDLHSYQPSVRDIAMIARADVFCYVGGVSDTWVNDVLDTTENRTAQLVSMAEAADADEEVLAEGMQAEHEHEHEHDHHDDESDSHEEPPELDEHVWLSLRRAVLACTAMKEALCKADPAHEDIYNQNCTDYLRKLQELDSDFTEMTSQAARDTIVVADRFPFRYLAEDYGLTYYAAFPGCSAETEASFETIVFLSEKVESLHLPCVLVTEGSNSSLAKTILENAGSDGKILTLQSLQAVSQKEIDAGVTYLSKMQENYDVLKQALNS